MPSAYSVGAAARLGCKAHIPCAAFAAAHEIHEQVLPVDPGLIDLTVGSFDSPDALPPTLYFWTSKRVPWVEFDDGLPWHAEFPPFGD